MSTYVRRTPPMNLVGLWQVKAPYQIKPGTQYTCKEIRNYIALELNGIDVYERFYGPVGLKETDYERDMQQGVNIITLMATDGEKVYVPDTYILAFPNLDIGDYRRFVISLDCGALPRNTNLQAISQKAADSIQGMLGRSVRHHIHLAPVEDIAMTPSELRRVESNRKAAIIDRSTSYGKLEQLSRDYDNLLSYNKILQKRLQDLAQSDGGRGRVERQLQDAKTTIARLRATVTQNNTTISTQNARLQDYEGRLRRLRTKVTRLGGTLEDDE